MPFLIFRRDHLRSTSGIIFGSGSFSVRDHLRSNLGKFPVWGSFAVGEHLRRWCCTVLMKILKLHEPKLGSCKFENFQNHSYLLITNCTHGHAISYTYYKLLFLLLLVLLLLLLLLLLTVKLTERNSESFVLAF